MLSTMGKDGARDGMGKHALVLGLEAVDGSTGRALRPAQAQAHAVGEGKPQIHGRSGLICRGMKSERSRARVTIATGVRRERRGECDQGISNLDMGTGSFVFAGSPCALRRRRICPPIIPLVCLRHSKWLFIVHTINKRSDANIHTKRPEQFRPHITRSLIKMQELSLNLGSGQAW